MLENEEDYLTSKGFQGRALKAMLDRAIQPKDTQTYDLSVGNINEYGIIENFIENSWIVLTNFPDYVLRAIVFTSIILFGWMGNSENPYE